MKSEHRRFNKKCMFSAKHSCKYKWILRLTSICICNTKFCWNLYFPYQNVVATAEYIQYACLDTSLASTSLMLLISVMDLFKVYHHVDGRVLDSAVAQKIIWIHSCFKFDSPMPFQNFPPIPGFCQPTFSDLGSFHCSSARVKMARENKPNMAFSHFC